MKITTDGHSNNKFVETLELRNFLEGVSTIYNCGSMQISLKTLTGETIPIYV